MIGVTGATGLLGGMIAQRLAEAGERQILLVRDPARAPDVGAVAVHEAPYGSRDAVRRAAEDVNVMLMVSASESADRMRQHRAFVDAVAAAGVRHLVYTSFLGAAPDATFTLARDHWATEQHIRDSGVPFTFLRDGLYLDMLPMLADDEGVIRGPAGEGRVSAVARADVAAAAAAVLADADRHIGATYDLTGPEALTLGEVAATLSEVTGREHRFVDETVEEAYASRAGSGAPGWQLDAWVSTYTAMAAGELDTVTDSVEALTRRAPTSLREHLAAQ